MSANAIFFFVITMVSSFVWADEIPNGKDAFVKENAVNIPMGMILLAKRNLEYCAVKFLSNRWSEKEAYATYTSYYAPNAEIGFDGSIDKPTEDEVYQKPLLSG